MKMRKVLILTETIGGNGHFQAARSLSQGLSRVEPELRAEISRMQDLGYLAG